MNLYSKSSNKLSKNQVLNICRLKDTHWKYGLKSQKNFFFKNVGREDIHNIIFIKKKIIGYTLLRKSKIKYSRKQENYLHFDTLIINKKFRGKNISKKLMQLNNRIIKKNKTFSILLCNKSMIKYYQRFNWNEIDKKMIRVRSRKTYMIYNKKMKKKFILLRNK